MITSDRPFVSIVIPLYNKEKAIVSTLRSILDSTFQDFEIVIVDDGSTDGSVSAARSVSDHRIRLISRRNGGPSAARNTGAKAAKGEWILFFDADDILYPDGLAILVSGTRHKDVTIVNAMMDSVDENGTPVERNNSIRQGLIPPGANLRMLFFHRIVPRSNNTLIRSDYMLKNLFDESLIRFEDSEVSLRWAKTGVFYGINKPVAALRLGWREACFSDDAKFTKDWGASLPFEKGDFWNNCFLARILSSTIKAYPLRLSYLENKYSDYLYYRPISDLFWKVGRLLYRV